MSTSRLVNKDCEEPKALKVEAMLSVRKIEVINQDPTSY